MKRSIALLLLMTLCLTVCACAPKRITEKGSQQVSSEDVIQILVRHFPESDGYTRNYTLCRPIPLFRASASPMNRSISYAPSSSAF